MAVNITNAISSTGDLVVSFNKNEEDNSLVIHSVSKGANVKISTEAEAKNVLSVIRTVWGL